MPTYEYECKECGHVYEKSQTMSETPDSECPRCRGLVKRLISGGTGVIFKGSGFYVTDSKRSNPASTSQKKSETCSAQETGKCTSCAEAKESA